MRRIIDLTHQEAHSHFLKGSSYFNGDIPSYLSFEPILTAVSGVLQDKEYTGFQQKRPHDVDGVNYKFFANKDGRFAWRPYELMHPAIYVSLVNVICKQANWKTIQQRINEFEGGIVECCSAPVLSEDHQSDAAAQVRNWWQLVEQKSLELSLQYSHLLHTDVTNCYGSLYTHSIAWAIHGQPEAKDNKSKKSWLGNKIDSHIQAGRFGQTNGIAQGSAMMDFIAEIVLGWVDQQINHELGSVEGCKILRYRDDYRIFANSDEKAELILKVISDKLQEAGMSLGVSKTVMSRNVIESSVKPDKLAGIDLQDLGKGNAKTIQKQLLRLHSFGRRHPNSGALRRLVSEFHENIHNQEESPEDLAVQVAIATDIAFVSPGTFPAVAGILSHLISLAPDESKQDLWTLVREKMERVPYNGYLEVWLQRVTKPKAVGLNFESEEPICRIVNGKEEQLWDSSWIQGEDLRKAVDTSTIVVGDATEIEEVVKPNEIELFTQSAWSY